MIEFRRGPRLREIVAPIEIRFPQPPTAPPTTVRTPLRRVLVISLLPAVLPPLGLAIATIALGQQSQLVVTSVVLVAALGIALTMTTLLSRRDEEARERATQAEYHARLGSYEDSLLGIARECAAHGERLVALLARSHPGPAACVRRAETRAPELWERGRDDPDFLAARLGIGTVPSGIDFGREVQTAEPCRAIRDEYGTVGPAPVTLELGKARQAGLVGDPDTLDGVLNAVLVGLVTSHGPDDLHIAVFSRSEALAGWAKWLPHTRTTDAGRLQPLTARGSGGVGVALAALERLASDHAESPALLIVADQRGWPALRDRVEHWAAANARDARVLWVADEHADLPRDCDVVAAVAEGGGSLRWRSGTPPPATFAPDCLGPAEAMNAALALAPLGVVEAAASAPVPAAVRLVDVVGRDAATIDGVIGAWERNRQAFRLAAPLGVKRGGELLEVDLRRDGPHGLIAGTTGAGKSELLQALVVGLAARVPPDLVNFLLLDYKGGSTFREILALPHVVGMVTDLDEQAALRALTSLRAELRRREALLAGANPPAANIAEYQRVARPVPLANLVIIIDEFHRLVSEQPDFIDQMVRIAQQGRSLGIHLLLATQKPSGAVSDHIRANTNLRICLRVTDDADSRDVLGIPDAAAIPRDVPGRAYVRVGAETPALGQVARVSGQVAASEATGGLSAEWFVPPRPRPVRAGGVTVWFGGQRVDRAGDTTTIVPTVDARILLLDAIEGAARRLGIPVQVPPWVDALPEVVSLASLPPARGEDGTEASCAIGLLDEPEAQRRRVFRLDPEAGHILVAGAANTGKTSTLLAVAHALAAERDPAHLHVYGFDFAGAGLAPLLDLPHCGGVARQYDPESVRWLLDALREFVARRSAATKPAAGWPLVLVIVDNFLGLWGALQSSDNPTDVDDLVAVMDVARSVGIVFALSVDRPEALRPAVLATLGTRLVLPLPTPEGYAAVGLWHHASRRASVPGRAILADGIGHEVQIAEPETEPSAMRYASVKAAHGGPIPIAPLPRVIPHDVLCGMHEGSRDSESSLLLGLREGIDPLLWYPATEHLMVLGPRGSGRSNTLGIALAEACSRNGADAMVWNPRSSAPLRAACGDLLRQGCYAEGASADALWTSLAAAVELRRGTAQPNPLVVLIDDAERLDVPPTAADLLSALVLQGPDIGVRLYVSANTQALRATYPTGWIRTLLTGRRGLLLAPQVPEDFDFFGVRGRPMRAVAGRGFLCAEGSRQTVQIALRA